MNTYTVWLRDGRRRLYRLDVEAETINAAEERAIKHFRRTCARRDGKPRYFRLELAIMLSDGLLDDRIVGLLAAQALDCPACDAKKGSDCFKWSRESGRVIPPLQHVERCDQFVERFGLSEYIELARKELAEVNTCQ